jgi:hypothetical protein
MNMQEVARSSRPALRIKSYALSNGCTLVLIGYLATLLSIAIWAAWQLVVSYAGAST